MIFYVQNFFFIYLLSINLLLQRAQWLPPQHQPIAPQAPQGGGDQPGASSGESSEEVGQQAEDNSIEVLEFKGDTHANHLLEGLNKHR